MFPPGHTLTYSFTVFPPGHTLTYSFTVSPPGHTLTYSFTVSPPGHTLTYSFTVSPPGLSHAAMHTSSATLMGPYFHARRGLANAVSNTGVSVSALVIPPLTQLLITSYGTRGALLLVSGINMQAVIAACLMRPVEFYERKRRTTSGDDTEKRLLEETGKTDGGEGRRERGRKREGAVLEGRDETRQTGEEVRINSGTCESSEESPTDHDLQHTGTSTKQFLEPSNYPQAELNVEVEENRRSTQTVLHYKDDDSSQLKESVSKQTYLHSQEDEDTERLTQSNNDVTTKVSVTKDRILVNNVRSETEQQLEIENNKCSFQTECGNPLKADSHSSLSSLSHSPENSTSNNHQQQRHGPSSKCSEISNSYSSISPPPRHSQNGFKARAIQPKGNNSDDNASSHRGGCVPWLSSVVDLSLLRNWLFLLIVTYFPLGQTNAFLGVFLPALGVSHR